MPCSKQNPCQAFRGFLVQEVVHDLVFFYNIFSQVAIVIYGKSTINQDGVSCGYEQKVTSLRCGL